MKKTSKPKEIKEPKIIASMLQNKCSVLELGFKASVIPYYYCITCDVEQNEPICVDCSINCHKDHMLSELHNNEIKKEEEKVVCECGIKGHKIESSEIEEKYLKKCFFHELSTLSNLNVYYSKHDNINICMFCANFCQNEEDSKQMRKVIEKDKENVPECGCSARLHDNINDIYNALSIIYKFNNTLENITPTQIINLLFLSDGLYQNLFSNLESSYDKVKADLETDNIELNAKVQHSLYAKAIRILAKISRESQLKRKYFSINVKKVFELSAFREILLKNYDTDQIGVVNFRIDFFDCVYKFNIESDFAIVPKLKVFDLENLTPLQRTIIISNIRNIGNFLQNYLEEDNIIEFLLKSISAISKERFFKISGYQDLYRLTDILKKFAKFRFFSGKQQLSYCSCVEDIFSKINFSRKKYTREDNEELREYELKSLQNIAKSLLYFSIDYNDKVVLDNLSGLNDDIKFFHTKNEIGKNVSKNCLELVNYIRQEIETNLNPSISSYLFKIINLANQLISLSILNNDFYLIGLKRNIDKFSETYIRFINNQFRPKELEFITYLQTQYSKLEKKIFEYYNYQINYLELAELLFDNVDEFFDKINIDFSPPENLNLLSDSIVEDNAKILKPNKKKVFAKSSTTISNDKDLNGIEISDYKILLNKSYYIFSLAKIWSIFYQDNKQQSKQKLEDKIIEKVLKVLYFYVDDNADNCILALSNEILNVFTFVDGRNSYKILEFFSYCLNVLRNHHFEFSSTQRLINAAYLIYKNSLVSNNKYECLKLFLKIIRIFLIDIPCLNHYSIIVNVRDKLKSLLNDDNIFEEFKNYLLRKPKNSMIEEVKTIEKSNKKTKKDSKLNKNNVNDEKIGNCEFQLAEKIFIKFIKLLNFSFDDNAMFNDNEFLSNFLSQKDIFEILNNFSLPLVFRTELIHFFRMVYMDVTIDISSLNNYRNVFCSSDDEYEENSLIKTTDHKTFQFLEKLMKVSGNTIHTDIEFNLIFNELKNFELILETNSNQSVNIHLNYLEDGIIVPLKVYLKKVFSVIHDMSGGQILQIYKLAVYLLKFKLHILKNPEIINMSKLKSVKDISEEFSEEKTNNKDKKVFKSIWKLQKHKSSLLKSKFNLEELEIVKKDLKRMQSDSFQPFDYHMIYNIIANHFFNFIKKTKSKSLKDAFLKSQNLDVEKINILETKLVEEGFLTSEIEKKTFRLINLYEMHKDEFHKGSLMENLSENSSDSDVNYKNLLIRYLFILSNHLNNFKNEEYLSKNCNIILLKLLQNDTSLVQIEIQKLNTVEPKTLDLPNLFNYFVQNLISVIFSSYNPSAIHYNHDYTTACTIIKIFKYLCEEHNPYFQKLLMRDIEFEVEDKDNPNFEFKKISFYDMILLISNKVLALTGWENSKKEDDSVKYFFDLFSSLIDLLIECVQGSMKENFRRLYSEEEEENRFRALPTFLINIKAIIFKDIAYSETVYNVRKSLCEYLISFLEEKKCPITIKKMIINTFYPQSFLHSIINTLKKYYVKSIEEQKIGEEKIIQQVDSNNEIDFIDNQYLVTEEDNLNIINYKSIVFGYDLYKFLYRKYYHDDEFTNTSEFQLANTYFKYIKILAVLYDNNEAKEYLGILEDPFKKVDNSVLSNFKYLFNFFRDEDKINENIYHREYVETFYVMKFFENITRSIEVHLEGEKSTNIVIYTINPDLQYLTKSTKFEFLKNVNRHSRYAKLFSLIEHSDYFLDEINFNKEIARNNSFLKISTKINFFYVEFFMFLVCLTINIYMLATLSVGDLLYDSATDSFKKYYHQELEVEIPIVTGDQVIRHNNVIKGISIFQVVFNVFFFIIWMLSKFKLYIKIDKKKFCLKNNIKEEDLKWYHNYLLIGIYYSIYLRNEVMMLIWNAFFGIIGIITTNNYIYSIQLLHILNLSTTLKNIIVAIKLRWNQLLSTMVLTLIIIFAFSICGYFFLHEEFKEVKLGSKEFPREKEDICESMMYCYLGHTLWGLFRHGGIGDMIERKSWIDHKGEYMKLFFYNFIFFIVICLIMLNLVFGIIIDTFKELRIEETKNEIDIANVCFICGVKKDVLEKNCQNFEEHNENFHNVWNYAYYIIGLKYLDPQETNAIISETINKVDKKQINWIPYYQEGNNHNDEEENILEEKEQELKEFKIEKKLSKLTKHKTIFLNSIIKGNMNSENKREINENSVIRKNSYKPSKRKETITEDFLRLVQKKNGKDIKI